MNNICKSNNSPDEKKLDEIVEEKRDNSSDEESEKSKSLKNTSKKMVDLNQLNLSKVILENKFTQNIEFSAPTYRSVQSPMELLPKNLTRRSRNSEAALFKPQKSEDQLNSLNFSKVKEEEIKRIIEKEEQRNKKFHLSYSNLFSLYLCCCLKDKSSRKGYFSKVKMFEKAETEMAKTFDVVEMYRELHKMSGFISFFLDSKQLLLLDYLQRPKIVFKNLKKESEEKKIQDLIKCFHAYTQLTGDLESGINSKLLNSIDHHIKDGFKHMLSTE
jgi:hypothetical protein